MPAVAAPTGGTTYNMGGKLTEKEFVTAICGGCTKAGHARCRGGRHR